MKEQRLLSLREAMSNRRLQNLLCHSLQCERMANLSGEQSSTMNSTLLMVSCFCTLLDHSPSGPYLKIQTSTGRLRQRNRQTNTCIHTHREHTHARTHTPTHTSTFAQTETETYTETRTHRQIDRQTDTHIRHKGHMYQYIYNLG